MRRLLAPALLALPLITGGCIAKTIGDVAMMPVKAAGQAADWATTSQDESDRNYGRKMRKQEAREAKERRKAGRDRDREWEDAELREKQRYDRGD